jgi:hypothetical protein
MHPELEPHKKIMIRLTNTGWGISWERRLRKKDAWINSLGYVWTKKREISRAFALKKLEILKTSAFL